MAKKLDTDSLLVLASLTVILLGLTSYYFSLRNKARAMVREELQKLEIPTK